MKMGRPALKDTEKNHKITVSLPYWMHEYLKTKDNRSQYIAEAISEKIQRDTMKKTP